MKPIIPRDAALRFVDALQPAFHAISLRPDTGSPRFGHELELPDLRSRMLKPFLYIVFYIEQPDHIDVGRVLHAQRDIPQWMDKP